MNDQPFSFSLRLEDFDLSRLPISADALHANPDLLAEAISQYYSDIFRKLGGTANVAVTEGAVHVSWYPKTGAARDLLFDRALALLQKGNYREADPLLQSLHARFPDDEEVLFNYGMMLSEQSRLDQACRILGHLVELAPGHSHGWTALGVALVRSGNKPRAAEAFQAALKLDPSNAYAMRNAGAILAESDLGYGTCLLRLGRKDDADPVLIKCIEINPLSDTAEHARTARTKLADETMRSNVADGLRPDVVMYCLGALQKFQALGSAKAKAVTFEIAMLGRDGLDINDSTQKYTLKSLPGKFSGLHLVSIMYVGMKAIAPDQDAGIDLSREYSEAKKLFDAGHGSGSE